MATRDWFFWKKRAAHDPCHGKPNSNPTLRIAAATIAVSVPLMSIFDAPPATPPSSAGKAAALKFNSASQPLPGAGADICSSRYGYRPFFFEATYNRAIPGPNKPS